VTYKVELYQIGKRKVIDDFIESLTDKTISKIQVTQDKKIHALNLTEQELKKELENKND